LKDVQVESLSCHLVGIDQIDIKAEPFPTTKREHHAGIQEVGPIPRIHHDPVPQTEVFRP